MREAAQQRGRVGWVAGPRNMLAGPDSLHVTSCVKDNVLAAQQHFSLSLVGKPRVLSSSIPTAVAVQNTWMPAGPRPQPIEGSVRSFGVEPNLDYSVGARQSATCPSRRRCEADRFSKGVGCCGCPRLRAFAELRRTSKSSKATTIKRRINRTLRNGVTLAGGSCSTDAGR